LLAKLEIKEKKSLFISLYQRERLVKEGGFETRPYTDTE
jgi:hypothetical protein